MTDYSERVTAGIAWLNKEVPGWIDRISLDVLDISHSNFCVLGQVFDGMGEEDPWGDVEAGYYYAIENFDDLDSEDMGFYCDWNNTQKLTNEWEDRIREMRASAAQ